MPSNTQWPQSFGFSLYGEGPTYVISVQRGGIAHRAGIVPGDQVLEVDGHNVTDMSAQGIATLAKHSRTVPPTVGVVSRIQNVELIASRRWGFGFTLCGVKPTLVESVDPPGPAYQAGIRPGDIVLEVNGHKIRQLDLLAPLLSTRYGKVTLTVVPVETKNMSRAPAHISSKGEASRVRRARDLFAKMNLVLGSDYEKKMAIVGLLKKYAEDRNVDAFALALSLILSTPQQARLIREIRPFIPVRHRTQFDSILCPDNVSTSPTNYQSPVASTTKNTSGEVSELGLDLYADNAAVREVTIHRGSTGNFGFILRGHDPVYVESVTPSSPADMAGLRPGDAILKLNGLDVRKSSHGHVIRLLQGSGLSPRITVRHLYTEEGAPIYSPNSFSSDESSASSHISSSWLGDDAMVTDKNGQSFREKVDHLLTTREKSVLRKALMNYNMHRNVAQLVDDLTPVLDAPSKKTMWGFLLARMPSDHREYVLRYVDMPKHQLDLLDANPRTSNTSSLKQTTDSSKANDNDVHHMGSFRQQLDYLLMSRERSQLKRALQIYAEKRNVQYLLEDLSDILDTPSKRTLWFYIIPLLSPPHQRYCQRKLGLPEHVIKTSIPTKGKAMSNGIRKPGEGSVDVGRNAASPRRGDVVYHQDDFKLVERAADLLQREQGDMSDEDMTDLLDMREAWQLRARRRVVPDPKTPGTRSGEKHPDSGYLSRDGEQSSVTLNPDYVDAIGRKPNQARHVRMVRESSSQTTPRGSLAIRGNGSPEKNMDFKTVVHVYDNPNGRADILELQHPHLHDLPTTDLIDSDFADHRGQRPQFMGLGASVLVNGDYSHGNGNTLQTSTLQREGRFIQENTHINQRELPVASLNDVTLSRTDIHDRLTGGGLTAGYQGNGNDTLAVADHHIKGLLLDRYQVGKHNESISSNLDHGYSNRISPPRGISPVPAGYHHSGSTLPDTATPRSYSQKQNIYQNGNQSDVESDTSSAMKNSVTSFESFQTKAMKAIRALDDVVANEPSELEYGAVLDTPAPSIPAPPPPPPLPPAPPPPPPGHGSESNGSRKMQVKRMNWEKIEKVDDTMIWSKIGDTEDLADIVKYLELETQFSTRRNKISESFRDRRNEICILNPKKAYNISILLGHLKRGVATVKKALYQMDEQVLNPDLLRQMLAYAPDGSELEKYDSYKGIADELSKADQFMYQLTRVPGYHDRLKAMVFKANFSEKVDEVKHQLSCVRTASVQLQSSKRLARVLELVLAMGNYMNKGHQRVGQAVGFRITFLSQLELTKTSDNKATFLHVLADAVATRFPDALNLKDDLPAIQEAARVSNETIANELAELQQVLDDISAAAQRLKEKSLSTNDRFQEVISQFTSNAANDIKALTEEQKETDKVFRAMVVYFGEDPERVDAGEFFSTFANFINKFEKAHHHNIAHKRHYYKDGTAASGPSA